MSTLGLGNEQVGISFGDVDGCHPVVATDERPHRRQPLHLEVLVGYRLVDRTGIEAPPPLTQRLFLYGEEGKVRTLPLLPDWHTFRGTDREILLDRGRSRGPANGIDYPVR